MALFKRGEGDSEEHETVIGPSVKVEGQFVGSGNVVVEGVVQGTLKTSKNLVVGQGARLKADIEAANVSVAGEIHGNVKTSGKLELSSSAKVIGNVEASILVVSEGALLSGKCVMLKAEPGAPQPAKEKNKQQASTPS